MPSMCSRVVSWYLRDARRYPSLAIAMPASLTCRYLNGLATNCYLGARKATLSDLYSGERLAIANSYLVGSMGAAYIVGPLLLTPLVGKSVRGARRRAR